MVGRFWFEKKMSKKTELLNQIVGKNRGLLATEAEQVSLLSAIAQLEEDNPTPHPLESPELLNGNWRLLYTTSKELLSFDRFPLLQTGQIYQYLDTENRKVYNIAEIRGIPFLEGIISVVAEFTPVSEKRVNVNFQRSIVGLQRLLKYEHPVSYIEGIKEGKRFPPLDFPIKQNPDREAWLEVTYLDEELRIGRGNQGSIFLLSKS